MMVMWGWGGGGTRYIIPGGFLHIGFLGFTFMDIDQNSDTYLIHMNE